MNLKRAGGWLAITVTVLSVSGCANTARGIKADTENAAEKTAAASTTAAVKSALIADGRVEATNINVDTIALTKTVVLKGTVPSAEQKTIAEQIARIKAPEHKIDNRLTVAPKA